MRPLSYRSDEQRALLLRNQIATLGKMKQTLGERSPGAYRYDECYQFVRLGRHPSRNRVPRTAPQEASRKSRYEGVARAEAHHLPQIVRRNAAGADFHPVGTDFSPGTKEPGSDYNVIHRVTPDSYEVDVDTRECLLNFLSLNCPPGARRVWGGSLSQ
jgi:hypothetical protein